jgi:hypothetical protein
MEEAFRDEERGGVSSGHEKDAPDHHRSLLGYRL